MFSIFVAGLSCSNFTLKNPCFGYRLSHWYVCIHSVFVHIGQSFHSWHILWTLVWPVIGPAPVRGVACVLWLLYASRRGASAFDGPQVFLYGCLVWDLVFQIKTWINLVPFEIWRGVRRVAFFSRGVYFYATPRPITASDSWLIIFHGPIRLVQNTLSFLSHT
jgi:hypothetical protein